MHRQYVFEARESDCVVKNPLCTPMHSGTLRHYKTVKVQRQSKHILVTLARPEKSNALDDAMWIELQQVRPFAITFAIKLAISEGTAFCRSSMS